MIKRVFSGLNTDSTGKELFDYEEKGRASFNLFANEYYVTRIIPHWHSAFELFLLLDGQIRIIINGTEHLLSAGEGCFINSGVLHEFISSDDEPHDYHSFVFDTSIISGMAGSVFDTEYVRPLIEQGPDYVAFTRGDGAGEFAPMFERAFDACDREPPAYEFIVRSALSDIVLLTLDASSMQPGRQYPRAQDELAKKMISFINANLKEKIALKDISGAAAVSPRECQRIFEKYLRRSPISYLNMRRLYAAAEELARSDAPVTEIAMKYCFDSPSYFTFRFRRLFNVSPREYRDLYTDGGSRDETART